MKVIILTGEPIPNGMAATNRIKCYARAVKNGGLDCQVLVCRRTEVFGKPPRNLEGDGCFNGIPFHYIGGTPLRAGNVFSRQLNDRLDRWSTESYLRKNLGKGDVVLFYNAGDIKSTLRYVKAAHRNGAFCIRDLCELPYGTGEETRQALRLRNLVLQQQFPRFDGIISISDALQNLAKQYSLPSCKHIKVPILVDFDFFRVDDKPETPAFPFIFHAGTLYEQKDGILGMVEAFGKAKQHLPFPIKYILTGSIESSSCPDELRGIIQKYNLENCVEFVGYLSGSQIKDYLGRASLLISNRPKSTQDYYGFSTKLGEYLASGTPLIITKWGEAVNWLKDQENAFIVEPGDVNKMSAAIVQVFTHPAESREVGRAGQELCRQSFDYKVWSKPLVEFMNAL